MRGSTENVNNDPFVRELYHPEPDMEIVISGVAGRFPKSPNVKHENLLNKVDLITDTNDRRYLEHWNNRRHGQIYNLNKFDKGFFAIDHSRLRTMDPRARTLLEHTFDALLDAGVNPEHLRGTNTGVFMTACFSEAEKRFSCEPDNDFTDYADFAILRSSKSMLANDISNWLGIHGPSYSFDSACSSSLVALEQAYAAICTGKCDSAIVGGMNLCHQSAMTLLFRYIGILPPPGRASLFDEHENVYVRCKTIAVIFLQKARDAKRVYATIVE